MWQYGKAFNSDLERRARKLADQELEVATVSSSPVQSRPSSATPAARQDSSTSFQTSFGSMQRPRVSSASPAYNAARHHATAPVIRSHSVNPAVRHQSQAAEPATSALPSAIKIESHNSPALPSQPQAHENQMQPKKLIRRIQPQVVSSLKQVQWASSSSQTDHEIDSNSSIDSSDITYNFSVVIDPPSPNTASTYLINLAEFEVTQIESRITSPAGDVRYVLLFGDGHTHMVKPSDILNYVSSDMLETFENDSFSRDVNMETDYFPKEKPPGGRVRRPDMRVKKAAAAMHAHDDVRKSPGKSSRLAAAAVMDTEDDLSYSDEDMHDYDSDSDDRSLREHSSDPIAHFPSQNTLRRTTKTTHSATASEQSSTTAFLDTENHNSRKRKRKLDSAISPSTCLAPPISRTRKLTTSESTFSKDSNLDIEFGVKNLSVSKLKPKPKPKPPKIKVLSTFPSGKPRGRPLGAKNRTPAQPAIDPQPPEEYEIEAIRDVLEADDTYDKYYLVKWVGFPEEQNTWELAEKLARKLVRQFEETRALEMEQTRVTDKRRQADMDKRKAKRIELLKGT